MEQHFYSHRVGAFDDDPKIEKRNRLLKMMQGDIELQKATIKSMRTKIEAMSNTAKYTDLVN